MRNGSGIEYTTRMTTDGTASFTNVPDGTYTITTSNEPNQRTETTTLGGNEIRRFDYTDDFQDVAENLPVRQAQLCLSSVRTVHICAAFLEDRKKANYFAGRLFTNAGDGTRGNAFQHSYWVALMVRSVAFERRGTNVYGYDEDDYALAIGLAEAHEADSANSETTETKRNIAMDTHNNELGYSWAVGNSPDVRGIYHNDRFFCSTLRGRNRLSAQIHFRPNVSSQFTRPVPTNRPVYRLKNQRGTSNRSRLRPASDFPSGEQPCVRP